MNSQEIRALRKALGLTQDKLAQKLGVTPFTVRRWEAGGARPQPYWKAKLERLAKRIGLQ